MANNIPWHIIIEDFKGEIPEENKVLLQEWLSNPDNQELYLQLKETWLSMMKEGATFQSQKDILWDRMKNRIEEKKVKMYQLPVSKLKVISSIAAVFVIALLSSSIYMAFQWYQLKNQPIELSYTSLNGKSRIQLPDGSAVWLQANSALTYSSTPKGGRNADLKGVGYFDIVKDSLKLFTVRANDTSVEVYGTTFQIEAKPGHEDIIVSLLSGSVAVNTPATTIRINPGQEAVCSSSGQIDIHEIDLDSVAFWAKESLHIERKSIYELTGILAKWYGTTISIDPSVPDGQAYSFMIKNESLDEILQIMSKTTSITYRFEGSNHVKIFPKE